MPRNNKDAVYGWSLNGRSWTYTRRAGGPPCLEGSTDCPSLGLLAWMLSMSVAMAVPPLALWLFGGDLFSLFFVTLCCGILASLLLCSAWRVVQIRRALRGLKSTSELAARLGIDPQAVASISRVHQIPVWFVVNEQEYFRLDDFRSVEALLRPAKAPTCGSLLHIPAQSNHDADPDTLLRPVQPRKEG